MHNEELGLLCREVGALWKTLTPEARDELDRRVQSMPTVHNFPRITASIGKPGFFKAKHWITVSKFICCAIYGVF